MSTDERLIEKAWAFELHNINKTQSVALKLSALGAPDRLDDFALDVSIRDIDFAGRDSELWLLGRELRKFTDSTRALERSRKGRAVLEGMSPGEFELVLESVGHAGHMKLSVSLVRHRWDERMNHYENSIRTSFSFDPTLLPRILEQFESLLHVIEG